MFSMASVSQSAIRRHRVVLDKSIRGVCFQWPVFHSLPQQNTISLQVNVFVVYVFKEGTGSFEIKKYLRCMFSMASVSQSSIARHRVV